MKTIHKFELETLETVLMLPEGAQIVHVNKQGWGALFVWVMLNPSLPYDRERRILIYGTGWEIPEDPKIMHISTVQDSSGFVWHVFEKLE